MRDNFRASAVKFTQTKQIRAAPVPLNPMVTPVYNVLQQHPTRQMTDHGLSMDMMDEDVSDEANGSTIEEHVERSE